MTVQTLGSSVAPRLGRLRTRLAEALADYRISRDDLILIGGLLIATRLLIVVAIALAWGADTARLEDGVSDLFCAWDCYWYTGIADNGYQLPHQIPGVGFATWAFFPLLPLLMAGLSALTGLATVTSGVIIATIATGLGLYGNFLFARDLAGRAFARHATIVLALWPFAIHTAIPMTEALFVPLTIWGLLFTRRRQWLAAGIAAGLLSATRTTGVFLFLPMLMIAVKDHGFWRVLTIRPGTERIALGLALSGLGLALYMFYLNGLLGDALAFSHNQAAWQRRFSFPWMTIYDALNPLVITPRWMLANGLYVASGLAGLWLAVELWRRDLKPEAVFVAATLLIAFSSGSANSLPRYAAGLYPTTLAVALLSDTALRRLPVLVFLGAGLFVAAFTWGMEQFYVM